MNYASLYKLLKITWYMLSLILGCAKVLLYSPWHHYPTSNFHKSVTFCIQSRSADKVIHVRYLNVSLLKDCVDCQIKCILYIVCISKGGYGMEHWGCERFKVNLSVFWRVIGLKWRVKQICNVTKDGRFIHPHKYHRDFLYQLGFFFTYWLHGTINLSIVKGHWLCRHLKYPNIYFHFNQMKVPRKYPVMVRTLSVWSLHVLPALVALSVASCAIPIGAP